MVKSRCTEDRLLTSGYADTSVKPSPEAPQGRRNRTRKPRFLVIDNRTNVEYAHRLEMGFVDTDKKGRNVSQAPRPFLRKAIWDNKAKILRMLSGKK